MKTVLDLSSQEALEYFLQSENYSNIDLPKYFDFGPILRFVEKKVGKKSLNDCKKGNPSDCDKVNYKLFVNKNGRYVYRPLQLANPYLYYLLAREITSPDNWEFLKKRFSKFKNDGCKVESIPLPKKKKDKTSKGTLLKSWWENVEQQSIKLSLKYRYVFVTDIANCYDSIYTHSIDWALNGKGNAKQKKSDKKVKNIGKMIDSYIRAMQYGQTNGIPQGSVLFDFIAEMVLGYADMELWGELRKSKIKDYKILRYRDDYRIFSNSREDIETIAEKLQLVLESLNLKINSSKTKLSENPIEGSIKEDKLFYLSQAPIYQNKKPVFGLLQNELLFILQFSRKYPNTGMVVKLLLKFGERLGRIKKLRQKDVMVLTAIAVEIAANNPRVYSHVVAVLSQLIAFLSEKNCKGLVQDIKQKFDRLSHIGYLQLWMQRLTYKMEGVARLNYDEPLCKIVNKDSDVIIWNNAWLKDSLLKGFPVYEICSDAFLEEMPPVIKMNEVSEFHCS